MPLPDTLQKIADEVLGYLRDTSHSTPYAVYVYEPDQELSVRHEMHDLRAYLNSKGCGSPEVTSVFVFPEPV